MQKEEYITEMNIPKLLEEGVPKEEILRKLHILLSDMKKIKTLYGRAIHGNAFKYDKNKTYGYFDRIEKMLNNETD